MKTDKIVLSTGTEVYTNKGIVGLSLTEPANQIFHGYDGHVSSVLDENHDPEIDEDALTRAECVELADKMVTAWLAYRAAVAS